MQVVTRFAPSPTGFLHIGGARTALFNWLFARRHGGKYLLRIEDTDRARSTEEAIAAIHDGLTWLGLDGDSQTVYQSQHAARHVEAAEAMIERGTAFRCYVTPEEMDAHRLEAESARAHLKDVVKRKGKGIFDPNIFDGRVFQTGESALQDDPEYLAAKLEVERLTQAFRSPYRDGSDPPAKDAPFVVRLRAPDVGEIVNPDLVQGEVRIAAADIDDLVLLRADGAPTYMLAVVVDDHDMGVTHVIRGDDHLTNAARQIPIFQAMGWDVPAYAHIPLIHGPDGAKLSKRHGALAVQAYRDMGYLPEGLCAYLMRLGWSPGHDDVLSKEEAVGVFDLGKIGKAPSRLDFAKLDSVNAHFMKLADDARLETLLWRHLAEQQEPVSDAARTRAAAAIGALKSRAKTIPELAREAEFLLRTRPLALDEKAQGLLNEEAKARLARLAALLAAAPDWDHGALAQLIKTFAANEGIGLGKIGPAMRAALAGGAPAPDLGLTLELLGREESLARISDQT